MIRKIYLVVNEKKDSDGSKRARIASILVEKGIACVIAEGNSISREDARQCDAIFTLGGDGTLIQAARQLSAVSVPFFPINIGTLGYLSETSLEQVPEAIDRLLQGDYSIQERMCLTGSFPNGDELTALNDIVITRNGSMHILDINLYINHKPVHCYRADGIIVATATGSTGYNLSAGGAILEPESQMIVVTPICSHTLNAASLVLSGDDELVIEATCPPDSNTSAAAFFDGGRLIELEVDEYVRIRKSDRKISLIRFEDNSFLDVLYRKMKDD